MTDHDLVIGSSAGLYCPAGDFHIDPWRPVDRAVITHVLGSAQVRLEHQGQVWVVSGDYKLEDDGICAPFEPVRCHGFVTESTFGLPINQWQPQADIFAEINAWWRTNAALSRTSVLLCYAFGKAQRLLSGLGREIGPILTHGAVDPLTQLYQESGVALPTTRSIGQVTGAADLQRAMMLAPPSAQGTPWISRLGDYADGFASGWMQVRGTRRRRGVDRGFVLSDHADWAGLQQAIKSTGERRILVTHGQVHVMVRWLGELGFDAQGLETEYGGDEALEPVPKIEADSPPVLELPGWLR